MECTKLIVEGSWVNRGTTDEPRWQLMVYPVVTKFDQVDGIVGSFVLMDTDKFTGHINNDSIQRIFGKRAEPSRDITLHNFGDYTDSEGSEWVLLLTTKVPFIKDNSFAAKTVNGYMFLDEIKPSDEEDDLDVWIHKMLCSLTGPRTIHFEVGK